MLVYTLFGIMSIFASCYTFSPCYEGFGDVVEETRDVSGFYAISNASSFDVYVSQADTFSVLVEAQENLLPIIETNLSGGTLIIKIREFSCIKSSSVVEVFVTMPEIEELHLSGSGRIICPDLEGEEVELELNGSGRLIVDTVFCDDLYLINSGSGQFDSKSLDVLFASVKVSGSGSLDFGDLMANDIQVKLSSSGNISGAVHGIAVADVQLSGSGWIDIMGDAESLTTENSASGRLDLIDLQVINAVTRSSGSGNTYVNASGRLDVTITGSGNVFYLGTPEEFFYRITGSGEARPY